MTNSITRSDLNAWADNMRREMSGNHPAVKASRHPLARFESLGTATRAMLDTDDGTLQRALADNIIANSPGVARPKFVDDIKGVVDHARPVITAFGVESIAQGEGMTINWPIAPPWGRASNAPPSCRHSASSGATSVRAFCCRDRSKPT